VARHSSQLAPIIAGVMHFVAHGPDHSLEDHLREVSRLAAAAAPVGCGPLASMGRLLAQLIASHRHGLYDDADLPLHGGGAARAKKHRDAAPGRRDKARLGDRRGA